LKVTILEPAYYWRVNRDYDAVPAPHVVYFDAEKETLGDVLARVNGAKDYPRIVLHHTTVPASGGGGGGVVVAGTPDVDMATAVGGALSQVEQEVVAWAEDSIGLFSAPFSTLVRNYRRIPSVKTIREDALTGEVLQG